MQDNLETVGRALFPSYISFVNHSCIPNACLVFNQNRAEVRALRSIDKDEKIYISYIDVCKPREWRKEYLLNEYFFDCCCVRCIGSESLDDFDYQAKLLQQMIDQKDFKQAALLAEKFGDELSKLFGPYFPEVSLLLLKSFRCESATVCFPNRLLEIGKKAYESITKFHGHIPLAKNLALDLEMIACKQTSFTESF